MKQSYLGPEAHFDDKDLASSDIMLLIFIIPLSASIHVFVVEILMGLWTGYLPQSAVDAT